MTSRSTAQGTWLREFRHLFAQATTEHYGRSARMEDLENELSAAAHDRQVTTQVLKAIETSAAWVYDKGWPRFSDTLNEPVSLPLARAVGVLFSRLKHIEVVSVVLRFMYPKHYGILSPPVASLLCLPPPKDNISYYGEYLRVLRKLRRLYGLESIAAVDMGLWSAVHLSSGPNHEIYSQSTKQMELDPTFQIVRFENLLRHLPIPKGQDERVWLRLLAEAMVDRDELVLVAGLLAARSFEELVIQTADPAGISAQHQALDRQLADYVGELERLRGDTRWQTCRRCRNKAVHSRTIQLSKSNVVQFLETIRALERSAGSKA
ncbi:MAG TPA: hypothetical protein VK821_13020 [Dehalococcoidia bacterium]|nr:hypothetical protein [Dehalococcoidia bacterium]